MPVRGSPGPLGSIKVDSWDYRNRDKSVIAKGFQIRTPPFVERCVLVFSTPLFYPHVHEELKNSLTVPICMAIEQLRYGTLPKQRTVISALYIFVTECLEMVDKLALRMGSSGGSNEAFTVHLFTGGLLLESLIPKVFSALHKSSRERGCFRLWRERDISSVHNAPDGYSPRHTCWVRQAETVYRQFGYPLSGSLSCMTNEPMASPSPRRL
jgi:hypothetical protein